MTKTKLSLGLLMTILIVGMVVPVLPNAFAATATVSSAKVISSTQIQITFSDPLDWVIGDFTNLVIDSESKSVDSITETAPSSTVTITFSGATALTQSSTGSIDIASISDGGSGNDFTGLNQAISDGQAPSVTSVSIASDGNSGYAKSGDKVTVTVVDDETLTVTAQTIDGNAAVVDTNNASTVVMSRTMDGSENEGALAFSITVQDSAGNSSVLTSVTDATSVTSDFTAPSSPSTPDLDAASDLGTSSTDNITNDDTPTFTVAGVVSGDSVQLFRDGVATGSPVVASGTSVQLTAASVATGTFTAKSTDPAGNLSSASSGLSVTIDTVAPVVTSVDMTTTNSNAGYAKSGDTVTVTVVDDETLKISSPTIGGQTASIGTDNANTVTITRVIDGSESQNSAFSITVADIAGNTSTLTAVSGGGTNVVIDYTKPVISLTGASNINIVRNVGTYVEPGATADTGETVILSGDTDPDETAAVSTVFTINYNVTDLAGNVATQVQRTVTITAGNAPVITDNNSGITSGVLKKLFSVSTGNFTATDVEDNDSTVTSNIVIDVVAPNSTSVLIDQSQPFSFTPDVTGTWILKADVPDSSGNSATQITRNISVTSGNAPVITLTGSTPVSVNVGDSYTDAGATASDTEDGDLTSDIVITGTFVNTSSAGQFTKIFNVQDLSGNDATTVTRIINVLEVNEEIIPVGDTTASISGNTALVLNNAGAALTTVTVDSGSTNPTIRFDGGTFSGSTATVPNTLTITANNAGGITVKIPASTTITGTGWDGVLTMPKTTSVSVGGFDTGVAIQFGDPDRKLTFSSPVIITLPGQTGKSAFITEFDGTQNKVTVVCDDEFAPTNVPASFACVFDNGTDLVIHTKTASTFSSGSPTATATKRSGSTFVSPPTLGVDIVSGERNVENGFTCNNQSVNVEYFFTPFDQIVLNVGDKLICDFKIFDVQNGWQNISHFEFALGKKRGESMSEEYGKLSLDIDWDRTQTVTYDKTTFDDVVFVASDESVPCAEGKSYECLAIHLELSPRVPFKDDIIVGTQVWNTQRSNWNNYFNHGIEVTGHSLNPAATQQIPGPLKYEGLITVTQIDDGSIWASDDGRQFEKMSSGTFVKLDDGKLLEPKHRIDPKVAEWNMKQVMDKVTFDFVKNQKPNPTSFAYDFSAPDHRELTLQKLGRD